MMWMDMVLEREKHPENFTAAIETVQDNDMFSIMLTTWNTIKNNAHRILECAQKMGVKTFYWSKYSHIEEETATLLRKINFEGGNFSDFGWFKTQIEI